MKRSVLAMVAVVTVLLTGLTLHGVNWFEGRSAANLYGEAQPPVAKAHFGADACRWRDCQPRHWHDLLVRP
jgi:hypothetical protein